MEPLKNVYNLTFFRTFLSTLKEIDPNINDQEFLNKIFTDEWEQYELKERMRHVTKTLHLFLNSDFKIALKQIIQLISILQKQGIKGGLEHLCLPDYVEVYGKNHLVESVASFEIITPFVTCEFAIRPFLIENTNYVIAKMTEWSFHPNLHIRRLASEGCRPRLPWAMALPDFKKNPTKILPVLKNLLNDSELYVKKSVANNLNDISKDHKEVLIQLTEKHYGETEHTDWILKHANRTLLKQAEPRIMTVFGFGNTTQIDVQNFKISQPTIQLGSTLYFSFNIVNNASKDTLIRLEYAVYYLKKSGQLSKKIFQISQKQYPKFSINKVQKKQLFKPLSTRKHYLGNHKISIIANGKEFDCLDFELVSS